LSWRHCLRRDESALVALDVQQICSTIFLGRLGPRNRARSQMRPWPDAMRSRRASMARMGATIGGDGVPLARPANRLRLKAQDNPLRLGDARALDQGHPDT
jgi:hypothetical protein